MYDVLTDPSVTVSTIVRETRLAKLTSGARTHLTREGRVEAPG